MGAWIEILKEKSKKKQEYVAPHVGAWIEMRLDQGIISPTRRSLPTWERGLKFEINILDVKENQSLPTWERGLKSCPPAGNGRGDRSLPTWERGLKLEKEKGLFYWAFVAPHAGAWIEIHHL